MYYPAQRRDYLYQTGSRFSLSGWTPEQWAAFVKDVEPAAAQLYGTIFNKPVARIPTTTPTVSTPVGQVPAILVYGLLAGGVYALLTSRKRRSS